MSAWVIISVESEVGAKLSTEPLKIDRQHLIHGLQSLWPTIEITLENNQAQTLEWCLSIHEANIIKASFDGNISFFHNHDCAILDAHSSASYVAKFMHLYREIVPRTYRLCVGNDWGGPEDQFDLIQEMTEIEIHDKIRDWVYE